MRAHLGESKTENLEMIEEALELDMTDEAWNALARLTNLQLCDVRVWLRECVKQLKANARKKACEAINAEMQSALGKLDKDEQIYDLVEKYGEEAK